MCGDKLPKIGYGKVKSINWIELLGMTGGERMKGCE